jgi:transcriptional regulator with XRE-family HTH domain
MTNKQVRDSLKKTGILQYELAQKLGISEAAFSRLLRHELPPDETEKLLTAIDELCCEGWKPEGWRN